MIKKIQEKIQRLRSYQFFYRKSQEIQREVVFYEDGLTKGNRYKSITVGDPQGGFFCTWKNEESTKFNFKGDFEEQMLKKILKAENFFL